MTLEQAREHAALSKKSQQTSQELRQYVLKVCHETLLRHYGENYSMRCFQSSIIIKDILNTIGIKSVIVLGATCVPRVIGTSPYQLSWNGFWDKDHHIWLMTEFCEIVDLTISQLHLHPLNIHYKAHAIPPLWWYPGDEIPSMFKYLPDGKTPALEDESKEDLQQLRTVLRQELANAISTSEYGFILHGMVSMEQLLNTGDHWAAGVLTMQQMNLPLPEWIANRERELLMRHR